MSVPETFPVYVGSSFLFLLLFFFENNANVRDEPRRFTHCSWYELCCKRTCSDVRSCIYINLLRPGGASHRLRWKKIGCFRVYWYCKYTEYTFVYTFNPGCNVLYVYNTYIRIYDTLVEEEPPLHKTPRRLPHQISSSCRLVIHSLHLHFFASR